MSLLLFILANLTFILRRSGTILSNVGTSFLFQRNFAEHKFKKTLSLTLNGTQYLVEKDSIIQKVTVTTILLLYNNSQNFPIVYSVLHRIFRRKNCDRVRIYVRPYSNYPRQRSREKDSKIAFLDVTNLFGAIILLY